MATIVLSAAGMALGGTLGGSVLGLSAAVIGRAAGAVIGRYIDQQLLGAGSEPVETGRIDRFRIMTASEGTDIGQVYGRMRIAGQVIWATQFSEGQTTTGGKGASAGPATTTYNYKVSIAVALCEGQISGVGRIWADGAELAADDLNMRVYPGSTDQQPDPKIAAIEGVENVPAYRGTAYVVFEDLPLAQFGNRVPQLTFEVMRPAPNALPTDLVGLTDLVTGVALIPGTGEYGLATSPVFASPRLGEQVALNTNTPLGGTDLTVSLNALQDELPACKSMVLVVSWFGNDLRCGECRVKPKVEKNDTDPIRMPWRVSGEIRADAARVPFLDNMPVYGGTPADASVIEAITDLRARGIDAVFYPFILMDQLPGNDLPDPENGQPGQPAFPWRGRITTSRAPGVAASPDETDAAADEVALFFGNAAAADFDVADNSVSYTGPTDWGYRRFILHYAHLCAAAGGVSAFCIGSEMRGLTQIRAAGNSFPAVAAFVQLAADVRGILGPDCKISYAADWTEYHGYQPAGTADKFFHLDPLWADANIDFIGIDNYMPLADWRDSPNHADSAAGSIYNLDYLAKNVAGGEGYDWYYHSPEARDAQIRTPITDGAGEPWVWRTKDLAGWWSHQHNDRINGVRQATPTAWLPQSKPIWFTEFGCAAINKGANQPNKFLDPKSSESQLPYYSNGNRDDYMQMQYIKAVYRHFADPANNPVSIEYGAPMLDQGRMHVWAWDARPYPFFPGNRKLWSDGANYARGHWLNGRATHRALSGVVAEICERAGVSRYDVSALSGVVRGYNVDQIRSGRAALQPLMLAFGFDAVERGGVLVFQNRASRVNHVVDAQTLAIDPERDQALTLTRAAAAEISGRVQLAHIDADADYAAVAAEAIHPDEVSIGTTKTEVTIALTRNEGQATVTRWIAEARIARDSASFALPPSQLAVGAGDVVRIDTDQHQGLYRIDRVEESGLRLADATRIDDEIYRAQTNLGETPQLAPFAGPVPVNMLFMDLPLLTGDESPHAPYVATAGRPWPGSIAIYSASQDSGYTLLDMIPQSANIGVTLTDLPKGPFGIWDRQAGFQVRLVDGTLSSVSDTALLSGANTFAVGDGTPDAWEIVQARDVAPVAAREYELSHLLRGQAGSRGIVPNVWPAGSWIVALDGVPGQITLPSATRGQERHYRFGPAKQPMTHPSFRHTALAFQGNGLRPYPVAHLQASATGAGRNVSWIRCSRIDGDLWADGEIPLGEDSESYIVQVSQDGVIRRQETVSSPVWAYDAAQIAADTGGAPYRLEVAQVSARYGAGPFSALVLQG